MKTSLFSALKDLGVKSFGAPLYAESSIIGTLLPGEYQFNEVYNQIELEENGEMIYLPVRRSKLEEGMDNDAKLTVAMFTATRDESGIFQGKDWSVTKGEQKVFVY